MPQRIAHDITADGDQATLNAAGGRVTQHQDDATKSKVAFDAEMTNFETALYRNPGSVLPRLIRPAGIKMTKGQVTATSLNLRSAPAPDGAFVGFLVRAPRYDSRKQ